MPPSKINTPTNTVLFRLPRQPGLEILLPTNKWVPVPVSPPGTESDPAPPILVNIGDLLSYWTDGLLRSTVHRVVFSGGENGVEGETDTEARYSIAYFCHPVGTAPLTAVPSERVREFKGQEGTKEGDKGKVLTANEHLMMRYVLLLSSRGRIMSTLTGYNQVESELSPALRRDGQMTMYLHAAVEPHFMHHCSQWLLTHDASLSTCRIISTRVSCQTNPMLSPNAPMMIHRQLRPRLLPPLPTPSLLLPQVLQHPPVKHRHPVRLSIPPLQPDLPNPIQEIRRRLPTARINEYYLFLATWSLRRGPCRRRRGVSSLCQ
jgi:hypothetical protein